MKKRMTLERAVDLAVAAENRRFLASPDEVRRAREDGDRWRKQMEDEGIIPRERPFTGHLTGVAGRVVRARSFGSLVRILRLDLSTGRKVYVDGDNQHPDDWIGRDVTAVVDAYDRAVEVR